ncbi:unnamed protein product [Ixodes hexagonus]
MSRVAALLLCALVQRIEGICIHRNFGKGSTVCVCDSAQCDMLGRIPKLATGVAGVYESSKDGSRFLSTTIELVPHDSNLSALSAATSRTHSVIKINRENKFQHVFGFGGSFTDSAGINIMSLREPLRDKLLESYFSEEGLDYNMGRVPIASSDFSTRVYSYNDVVNDFQLLNFKLASEDIRFKIPLIQKAQRLKKSDYLWLIASPWSAPAWMKTNNAMSGRGTLRGSPKGVYYKAWAEYFVKFLNAYKSHNITFWGITAQNEPSSGFVPFYPFQAMGFRASTQRDFVKFDLGPALERAGYGPDKLKLMILDDQRIFLPNFANVVLHDREASKYVAGIAFHWYWNHMKGPRALDETHTSHPDKFLLSTEACEGSTSLMQNKVILGSWSRAASYAYDIIHDMRHWTTGWVDWNLALNPRGGPNWARNFVDSPIIVNATAGEFYMQPMYYALAHFTKFVTRGSRRVDCGSQQRLETVAFLRPDEATVLVVMNRRSVERTFTVVDPQLGSLNYSIPGHAIQTYIWWS